MQTSKTNWNQLFGEYIYNWDNVSFFFKGFAENVTLDQLNMGATLDNGIRKIDEGLVPSIQDVRINGLDEGTTVIVGGVSYFLKGTTLVPAT